MQSQRKPNVGLAANLVRDSVRDSKSYQRNLRNQQDQTSQTNKHLLETPYQNKADFLLSRPNSSAPQYASAEQFGPMYVMAQGGGSESKIQAQKRPQNTNTLPAQNRSITSIMLKRRPVTSQASQIFIGAPPSVENAQGAYPKSTKKSVERGQSRINPPLQPKTLKKESIKQVIRDCFITQQCGGTA